jgi:hypothetical protein
MGLDSIELIMSMEEYFQISIPDEIACQMRTPGNIVDYILLRVASESDHPCLEQIAFYRLRRACMQVFATPRKLIRPNTKWEDILPRHSGLGRSHNWKLLHQATGTPQWPRLSLWNRIPEKMASVGETARYLAENSPASLKSQAQAGWSRSEVEEAIRRLICDQLGITDFRWDQDFVKDLGLS